MNPTMFLERRGPRFSGDAELCPKRLQRDLLHNPILFGDVQVHAGGASSVVDDISGGLVKKVQRDIDFIFIRSWPPGLLPGGIITQYLFGGELTLIDCQT